MFNSGPAMGTLMMPQPNLQKLEMEVTGMHNK